MIGFLSPLALFGLLAAGIPPLLHLLARKLPPVVPFPAVRYLSETERKHSRRLKLRNLLLLFLRTLLIVIIALAAARPVARVPFGGSHEPAAVAVIVDNSLSSGAVVAGVRVLDGIVDQARHVFDRTGDNDRVWLVLADGIPRRVSLQEARGVVDTLSPWPMRLGISEAVRAVARSMADDPLPGREVVLLSDLQATAIAAAGTEGDAADTRVLAWAPPPLEANRGIDSARVVPTVWSPSGEVIASLGGSEPRPAAVRLSVGDRDIARSVGSPADHVILSGSATQMGWAVGTVSLDPDELRGDDVRMVAIRIAPPAAAAVEPGAGPFVAEAVSVLQQSGRARAGDEVTFSDRLARGVTILFPPEDPAMVGAVNRTLSARGVRWQFGSVVTGEWQTTGTVGPGTASTVYQRRRLQGDGAVLGWAGGEPWLVRGGNVVLVGSRMESDWSALPVSAAFVPFLDFLINRVGATPAWIVTAFPGEVVEVPAEAQALLGPDGPVPIRGNGVVAAPLGRGVYFLQGASADTIGAVEVNHDPRETALAQAPAGVIRNTLGGDVQVLNAQGLDRELFSGARRADLTSGLLLLAVALALLEFGLSSAGARRES